jgi:hypothetical protein
VLTSTEATFDDHIEEIDARGRQRIEWIWLTFRSREAAAIITLFRTLVLPNLEYCCQLWVPHKASMVRKLDSVQLTLTSRISGMGELELNYWGRLNTWDCTHWRGDEKDI